MTDLGNVTSGGRKAPPQKILTLEEVVAKSVFDKEFASLKKELEEQKSITWQVVIGVAVAFVLAIGVIIVDTTLVSSARDQGFSALEKQSNNQEIQINNLNNQVENLRVRNPYLK